VVAAPFLALARVFTALDQHLLFDGASGALVQLSESAFAAWQDYLASPAAAAVSPPGLAQLHASGMFRESVYPSPAGSPPAAQGLHSLCLNVAHSCDLACDYCFAGKGAYGSPAPTVMQPATACAAIDYLIANSPPGRSLSVDFFGGEPLLAWPAVTAAVAHGRSKAEQARKTIRFTITTNAVSMDDARAAFCAAEMSTIIVSLDGRPSTHDRHRQDKAGRATFERALQGARRLAAAVAAAQSPAAAPTSDLDESGMRDSLLRHPDLPLGAGPLWVRGTYTADNLDFAADVRYLRQLGFAQISMEPVALPPNQAQALRPDDIPRIRASYAEVAGMVAAEEMRFFHFELNTDAPSCAPKRFTGCAAGAGYAAVDPAGRVFACHQFDGVAEFGLGEVSRGDGSPAAYQRHEELAAAHVGAKPACRSCWAQLYCGGGCHYAAWSANGDIHEPYKLGCDLLKARLEIALALQAARRAPTQPGQP